MRMREKSSADLALQLIFDRSKLLKALFDGERNVILFTFLGLRGDSRGRAGVRGHAAQIYWMTQGCQRRVWVRIPWACKESDFSVRRVSTSQRCWAHFNISLLLKISSK